MAGKTIEEFENKCMDIIEQIVALDKEMDRQGAINIASKFLDRAKEIGNHTVIDIYTRVLNEFKIATDEEYNLLRSQIFS